tara:strand:- start:7 stop:486 length:480 start_codon:yes stop_codon:yes gene_type:complete
MEHLANHSSHPVNRSFQVPAGLLIGDPSPSNPARDAPLEPSCPVPPVLGCAELPRVIQELLIAASAKGRFKPGGFIPEVGLEPVDIDIVEQEVSVSKRTGKVVGEQSPGIHRKNRGDTRFQVDPDPGSARPTGVVLAKKVAHRDRLSKSSLPGEAVETG